MPTNPNPFLRSSFDAVADQEAIPAQPVQAPPAAAIPAMPAIPMPERATAVAAPAAPVASRSDNLAPPPELQGVFEASARAYNVPVNVLMALAHQESGYDPLAIGREPTKYGRAKGVMQFLDATADSLGINPLDPNEAIPAAAKQIRDRLDKGASMDDAVKEHFAGPDRAGWKGKTHAYGAEVLAKAGKIGELLYSDAPAEGAPTDSSDAPANPIDGNKFSSALSKADYLRGFMELNPNASPAAQQQAMIQYDKDAAARTKAGGNRVQDKFAEMASPEATFNAKLNAKLQARNEGLVQVQPANAQPANPAMPRERPGIVDQAKGDFGRGIDNLKALGYGAAGLAADATGDDAAATDLLTKYVAIENETAKTNPATIGTYKNIKSMGDAGRYAIEAVAENLPMLLPSLVTGGVGAQAAKMAAQRLVVGMVEKQVASGVARAVAEQQAAKFVARTIMAGSLAGAAPASIGMESGSIMGDIYKDTGKKAAGTALAFGIPAGLLDSIEPVMALRKLAGPLVDDVAGGILKRFGVEAGKQFIAEAGTEGLQTVLEEAAKVTQNGKQLLTQDLLDQVIDSALKGGIGGAGIGMASQAVHEARGALAPGVVPSPQPQNRVEPTLGAPAPAAPVSEPAPIPAAPSAGPLSAAVHAAVPVAPAESFTIPGDDGSVHTFDGESIVPAGPLAGALHEAAAAHAENPIAAPEMPQAPPEPPPVESVHIDDLRAQLQQVGAAIKEGRTAELVAKRKVIEKEIGQRAKEARDATAKLAEEPTSLGPFDTIEEANTMAPRVAEKTAVVHEVVKQGDKFILQPYQEKSDGTVLPQGAADGSGSAGNAAGPAADNAAGHQGTAAVPGVKRADAGRPVADVQPDPVRPAAAAKPVPALTEPPAAPAKAAPEWETNPYHARQFADETLAGAFMDKNKVDRASFEAVQVAKARWKIQPKAEAAPTSVADLTGDKIDKEWHAFAEDSGTLNVDRADMPQVRAEHRGALTQFLLARGIAHEQTEMPAADLKPTQREFSPAKVQKARDLEGGDRSILVSSDNHVLDGHHQWLAKMDGNEPVKVIRLAAPIKKLLAEVKEFPSAEVRDGATATAPAAAEKVPELAPVAAAEPKAAQPAPKSEPKTKKARKPKAAKPEPEPEGVEQHDIPSSRTIEVDGVRRPIENSRGQLVAQDFAGQQAFWKWFGDSKAVDDQGYPMVAYHGTASDFNEFRAGTNWFAADPDLANAFVGGARRKMGERAGDGANVAPVYLSVKNPLDLTDVGHQGRYLSYGEFFDSIGHPEIMDRLESQLNTAMRYAGESGFRNFSRDDKTQLYVMVDQKQILAELRAAGYDAYKWQESYNYGVPQGRGKKALVKKGDSATFAPFDATQIKSATGNAGTFDPSDANITHDVNSETTRTLMADGPLARLEEPKRVMVLANLKRLQKLRGAGKITDEAYRAQVDKLIGRIGERNEARENARLVDRERGADWVEERLMRAKRQGDLDAATVDFALWALRKSPALATDLAISIRSKNANGTAGSYSSAARLMTIITGSANEGTAVHEMLHHTERMMPQAIQQGIAKAWLRAYSDAWTKADAPTRLLLDDLMAAGAGDKEAFKRTVEAFGKGKLDYDAHYQLVNASEFWAVNATRIMAGRYDGAVNGWAAKAKQWLTEMVAYLKGALGLKSDAAILKGLNAVLNGDGARISPKMLGQLPVAHDIPAPADPAPATDPGLTPPEQGLLRRVQSAVQNNLNRVKQVQDRIEKLAGAPVQAIADYYGAETNRPGRIATRLEDAQDKLTGPLMERLAKSGHTPEQLNELLHAMHAHERNEAVAQINPEFPDGGSGMTDEQANAILAQYEGAAELHEIAQQARDIAAATLDLKLAYGLITGEQHELLTEMYDNYVPLKGDGEYGPKIKRAMGHEGRDEFIMENIARDYAQAVVVGEKNLARQSLLQMVLRHADDALWTARVPPKGRYVAGTVLMVKKGATTVASFTSQSQVSAFLEAKGAEAGQYTVETSAGEQVVEFTKPLQDNEVMVYVKGQAVRLQIHDEKLAAQLRPLDNGQMNAFMEALRGLNRHLSKVYTGYNPAFILRNTARDALTGTINMMGNEGTGIAAKAWTKYPAALVTLVRWANSKQVPAGAMGAYLTEYRNHGGKVGASWMSDLEQQGKSLTEMYDDAAGLLRTAKPGQKARTAALAWRKTVGKLAHVIEVLNQGTENALRLSLFVALREAGQTPGQAAQAAKSVTVNFDRKGTATPALGAFYLFLNPAIQGTANAGNTLTNGKHKYQAWAALGGLATLGYLLAARGMDDDKDRWLGEGWDTRTKNFMLRVGDHQIKIPVSQEFVPFFAMGTALAEASRGESSMTTSVRLFSSFIDAYFPLNGTFRPDSDNHALDLRMAIMPTIGRPYDEIASNRSAFGSALFPETEQTKDRPDNLKMNRGTKNSPYDKAAQGIAAAGAALGSRPYENDWSKVSPETLKLLWRTYTGGLGGFIADATGYAGMVASDASQIESGDVPIVKDFWRPVDVKPIQGRFYDLEREVKAVNTEFKLAAKAGDGDAVNKIAADPEKARILGLTSMIGKLNKASGQLADEAVDVNARKDLTGSEKRAKLKEIDVQREQLYRTGIAAFK